MNEKLLPKKLIGEQILKKMVMGPEFNNTVYQENLNWIKKAGKIVAVTDNRTGNSAVFHLVLVLPQFAEIELKDVYQLEVVPFHLNGVCLEVSLPEYIYTKTHQVMQK